MLVLLACLGLGTPIIGRIEFPKDRPVELLRIRLVQESDEDVTLATSDVDADGRFRFDLDGLPPSALFVLDSHSLWLPMGERYWGRDGYDADEPYRLHALPGTAIHGVVSLAPDMQSDRARLRGASIRVVPSNRFAERSVLQSLGEDLSFAFDELDPELVYDVRLEQDGFVDAYQLVTGNGPGKTAQVVLQPVRAVHVGGHVLSLDGSALPGARVMLFGSGPDQAVLDWLQPWISREDFRRTFIGGVGGDDPSSVAGVDGSFSLDREPAADLNSLVVDAPGFRTELVSLGALHEGESRSDLVIRLTPHAELEITAIDEHGDPVKGATIAAFEPGAAGVGLCYARRAKPTPWVQALSLDRSIGPFFDWYHVTTDDRGVALVRLQSDAKQLLLDLRTGGLAGYIPEPLALTDGVKLKVTVILRPAAPVRIQFPSRLRPGGVDDVRVFDERGWERTAVVGFSFVVPYPWNVRARKETQPTDSLPGLRLAPLPAGRYTVKAVDATGKVHSKTFDHDPRDPRTIEFDE